MLRIEVRDGYDGKPCCDVEVKIAGHYSEVKISEPVEELDRRREMFLRRYFKER